ncbi:MAG: polysaccharide deacetylase family protein [Bacteroidales bacterium]|nr:polysaccharide deacetylase family protein [Bacteroidales bacterium]
MNQIRPSFLFPLLFRDVVFRIPAAEKILYLTFDDGPTPGVTPQVLDILQEYGAKASFFVCGEKVEKHPDLFHRICSEGHAVGNHTYSHLNGWKTVANSYLADVERAQKVVQSNLFRPPYGKLTWRQYRYLRKYYRIVLWDVMCGDYDPAVTSRSCCERIRRHAIPGSAVVFHDSEKAANKSPDVLEQTLKYFGGKGYRFEKMNLDSFETVVSPTCQVQKKS